MYKHHQPHNKIHSRRNLVRLMPLALRLADEIEDTAQEIVPTSLSGAIAMMQVSVAKLEGVHLYCIGAGQYHADLEFGDVPTGIPNIIGTPLAEPRPSSQAAEETAVKMLAGLIVAERQGSLGAQRTSQVAVFEVDGYNLVLPRGMLEAAAEAGYLVEADAARCIDEFRARMGGQLTERGLGSLSSEDVSILNFAMISMLLRGSPRYPRRWPPT